MSTTSLLKKKWADQLQLTMAVKVHTSGSRDTVAKAEEAVLPIRHNQNKICTDPPPPFHPPPLPRRTEITKLLAAAASRVRIPGTPANRNSNTTTTTTVGTAQQHHRHRTRI